jgi:hypothetical protein
MRSSSRFHSSLFILFQNTLPYASIVLARILPENLLAMHYSTFPHITASGIMQIGFGATACTQVLPIISYCQSGDRHNGICNTLYMRTPPCFPTPSVFFFPPFPSSPLPALSLQFFSLWYISQIFKPILCFFFRLIGHHYPHRIMATNSTSNLIPPPTATNDSHKVYSVATSCIALCALACCTVFARLTARYIGGILGPDDYAIMPATVKRIPSCSSAALLIIVVL